MTPQELKNSILQLAVQGKLVEQRPEEGTAEELYQQIQVEKQRLIKEGKIKKEKPLPEISEDEVPFEIPESWKWVRIGQIFGLQAGKNITASDIYDQKAPEHKYLCYGGNGIRGYVSSYNREGHFALIGRQGALCGNINFACGQFYATEHAVVVDLYGLSDVIWSGLFLQALNLNQYATATAQPGLAVANIVKVLIPLPPLAEQKRIASKIEELLPYIDRYGQAWTRLENFNKRFPTDMQKSLLQLAIQGKLVEQRSEEGTAEELYQQIQKEKQRLIKEGKIKKEKPLPEIVENEVPFEIPESWKWARLMDLTQVLGDGIHGTPGFDPCGEYYFINGNNLENGKIIIKDDTKRISYTEYENYRKPLTDNTILLSINGTIGNVAFYNGEPVILGKSACYFALFEAVDKKYIHALLRTQFFFDYAVSRATQTTIKNVSLKAMRMLPIPLPPLAEQKRIVAKLEELLPLCERLK